MPINLSDYTLDGYRTSYDKIKTSSYLAHECGTFFRRIVYISHSTELITREAIDWKNASNEFQLKGIYHENALSILFEIFLLFFFRNKFNADKKNNLKLLDCFLCPEYATIWGANSGEVWNEHGADKRKEVKVKMPEKRKNWDFGENAMKCE